MFRPMLAGKIEPPYSLSNVLFPVLVSPKLDGVRATIQNGKVMSRALKPIPNKYVQELFGKPELEGLDGELILGDPTEKDAFRKTTSAVMTQEGKPEVTFFVFDKFHPQAQFTLRLGEAERIVSSYESNLIMMVCHVVLGSAAQVHETESHWVEHGFEGLMIRSPHGPYKQGRSTLKEGYLLKLKRFCDGEALVLGFEEQMHNANEATTNELGYTKHSSHKENMIPAGCLGALLVKDVKTGIEFSIGTGFDENDRRIIWGNRGHYIGKIVTYRYFPTGSKEKPRFPTYEGWRSSIDMGE